MENRKIVVTGGSRGIGLEIIMRLLSDGYEVICLSRSPPRLVSPNLKHIPIDLYSFEEIIKIGYELRNEDLYGIINNAGIWENDFFSENCSNHMVLEKLFELNVKAPYMLTRILISRFGKGGRIVNMSSQLGEMGRSGMAAYAATKHALNGLTRSWAIELGRRNITCNAVAPGWVDTRSNEEDFLKKEQTEGYTYGAIKHSIEKDLILGRFISTIEVANLTAFLLSDSASGITGQIYSIR